ncbi:MaoC family dehydratase [Dactylosporangium sp. AC04546]|uniref:MaoC family dehydratase n=1 Tax=Dactylosporangium sp. AC04546 TaxID=2862460 RepID=UPI001EDF6B18|nr:MaoC family dehydratase [Dactylosporangium sp. AC04546]WVK81335.1 MaoC family dehydratase [Dactylosporangium sp. AC04546]
MAAFTDIEAVRVGDLGTTEWEVVDQARILAFADVTGDRQWIHVDAGRARSESPFGTTVAHGALTLALCTTFVTRLLRVEHSGMTVNAGFNKVRLRTPVPAGSRVRGRGAVTGVVELLRGIQVTVRITVEVDGSAVPACQAEQVLLILPAFT